MTQTAQIPQEISVIIENTGIEPSKAHELLGNLPQIQAERKILIDQYNEVLKLDINNVSTSKKASEVRKLIKENRTKGILVWHKTTKEFFLTGGKFVDAVKNREEAINERMEETLEKIEKHFEIQEAKRKADLITARSAELSKFTANTTIYPLGEMTEESYQELKDGLKLQKQAKLESERKTKIFHERKEVVSLFGELYDSESLEGFIPLTLETSDSDFAKLLTALENAKQEKIEKRKEEERLNELGRKRELEIATFAKFLTQKADLRLMPESEYKTLIESLRKAEADYNLEQENIRKENERQKKLLEEKEAQLKAEREEAEKKSNAERKERERLEKELEEKKQAEEKKEKEKKEAEIKEKKEAEKLAKAPIKKQMEVWAQSFVIPTAPIENEASKSIVDKFMSFKCWALLQIENF